LAGSAGAGELLLDGAPEPAAALPLELGEVGAVLVDALELVEPPAA
jgi:hypothetical protein